MTGSDKPGQIGTYGTILETCESLHMSKTGASDPLPEEVRNQCVNYLRATLLQWHPSPSYTVDYDNAVKSLIQATLKELDE